MDECNRSSNLYSNYTYLDHIITSWWGVRLKNTSSVGPKIYPRFVDAILACPSQNRSRIKNAPPATIQTYQAPIVGDSYESSDPLRAAALTCQYTY